MDVAEGTAPLYRLVSSRLAEEIETGALKRGDRVPSERAIGLEHQVSRSTARRALEQLADDGLVEFRGGVPVVVDRSEPANRLVSFYELAVARGTRPTAVVLVNRERPASLDEADVLGIAPGARVIEVERLRGFDGLVCGIDNAVVAGWALPAWAGIAWETASLYAELEQAGNAPASADYELGARLADARELDLLELDEGVPVIPTRTVCRTAGGRPLMIGTTVYRADRYRFTTALARSKGERTHQ